MDRLFLDANVLFSAAYRPNAAVARLWSVGEVELVTSRYAVSEAERNLHNDEQHKRLKGLLDQVTAIGDSVNSDVAKGVVLPEKDIPILAAAVAGQCSHLITGDLRHFGAYFGKKLFGVVVLSPAEYLNRRSTT